MTDLKGKTQPQRIYHVISERPGVTTRFQAGMVRGITDLVGRRPEMEALIGAIKRAREGEGQVVAIGQGLLADLASGAEGDAIVGLGLAAGGACQELVEELVFADSLVVGDRVGAQAVDADDEGVVEAGLLELD